MRKLSKQSASLMQSRIYKATVLSVLLLSLSGCMKYVYVPVWTCPPANIPQREALKTSTLGKDSDTDSILKAMIYDIRFLTSYSDQLLAILGGYQKKEGLSLLTDKDVLKP